MLASAAAAAVTTNLMAICIQVSSFIPRGILKYAGVICTSQWLCGDCMRSAYGSICDEDDENEENDLIGNREFLAERWNEWDIHALGTFSFVAAHATNCLFVTRCLNISTEEKILSTKKYIKYQLHFWHWLYEPKRLSACDGRQHHSFVGSQWEFRWRKHWTVAAQSTAISSQSMEFFFPCNFFSNDFVFSDAFVVRIVTRTQAQFCWIFCCCCFTCAMITKTDINSNPIYLIASASWKHQRQQWRSAFVLWTTQDEPGAVNIRVHPRRHNAYGSTK